jgi:glycosyltransferase involved in cell wall biosynthesis
MAEPTVAIIIPCFGQKSFLPRAISSALAQTVAPREVIVIDDGSDEDLSDIATTFPQVAFIRQDNRGTSGAKNRGMAASTSDRLVFLDADDALRPNALASGLQCFEANPDAAFVYGGFEVVTRKSREPELQRVETHRDMVRTNWIGMLGAVMFDRARLVDCGGFDESLEMCEDWDLFLRLSRKYPFASHANIVADYFRHDSNASRDVPRLRHWIEVVRSMEWERGLNPEDRKAWHEGEQIWRARVPDPVHRSPVERAARSVARALLRPFRA